MAKSKLILENSSLNWDARRRYKVNSVVSHLGQNWQNLTGENSEPGVGPDWFNSSSKSNFNLAGTSTDAGGNKTDAIERTGTVGGAPATAPNHFVTKSQVDVEEDTGTVIELNRNIGTYYNMYSANSATVYTFDNEILGGKAIVLINSSSKPTVTGATNIHGDTFEPNVNMYMTVWNNGNRVEYYFTKISSTSTAPPTFLNYTDLMINGAVLTWQNNSVEIDFSIERSLDGIAYSEIGTSTVTTYTDTTAIANTHYYYKVKIKNEEFESSYSNIIYLKTTNTKSEVLFSKMLAAGNAAPAFNKSVYDSGLQKMDTAGIISVADFFNLFASHGEVSALLNWISTSFNSTKGGTPAFTANRGYKGNGTNGYIVTAYNPLVDHVNLLENNGMVSVFTLDHTTENPALFEANSDAYAKRILVNPKNASNLYSVKFNTTSANTGTPPVNTIGLHTLIRTSSTAFSYYFNGVLVQTFTNTSAGLPNGQFYSLASELAGSISTFSTRQVSMVFAGSGSITPPTLYNAIKEMMMVGSGFSPIVWSGSTSGNYTALSGVSQTFVTTFAPTAVNDKAYNHHPFIIEHGGAIHLMYSTGNTNEEESGQYVRYQKSIDGGATFSTPVTLVVPQDITGGYLVRRVCLPSFFIVVEGSLYAIVDVNTRASGSAGTRTGVGTLAVKVNSNATFETPFWIINPAGNTTAPTPILGFPAYQFNTFLGSKILNAILDSERRPSFFYSCPVSNPLYTVSAFKTVRMEEPTVTKLSNGLWIRLWRILDTTYKKIAQYSFDGSNWGGLNTTEIPDWASRSEFLKCSDGRIILVGNNNTPTNRTPLFYAQSADGLEYKSGNIFNIDTETTGPVYPGTYKETGVQYPHLTELSNGKIAVAYSVNKEQIRVSIFNKPTLV